MMHGLHPVSGCHRWDLPFPHDFTVLNDPTDVSVDALLDAVRRGHAEYLDRLVTEWVRCSASGAALLGIAIRPDDTIVAHYVTPTLSADVLAEVRPETGVVRELAQFRCTHWPVCSSEHHGGNPIVAPDGSVFVPTAISICRSFTRRIQEMRTEMAGSRLKITNAGERVGRGIGRTIDRRTKRPLPCKLGCRCECRRDHR